MADFYKHLPLFFSYINRLFPGAVDDEDSRQEVAADDDSNCSVNQNFDAKLSRASSLYQGPSSGPY